MGKKFKDGVLTLKKMKLNRRYSIVVGMFLLMCFCVIGSFFLLFGNYNYVDKWFTFMYVMGSGLIGSTGAWLGIETSKLLGGRKD